MLDNLDYYKFYYIIVTNTEQKCNSRIFFFLVYYIADLRHSHSLFVCWTFLVKSVVTLVIE